MKIFLSHGSKNKPLIREVKSYFPEHIKLWIDEKDLLIGENINSSLREAIESNSDYVIMFLDNYSIKSDWVKKELSWALSHEKTIGRTFVLPIILDNDVIGDIEFGELLQRKYILCTDFTESSIKNLSNNIISELFAWLSRDLNRVAPVENNDVTIKLLDEADNYIAKLADIIRFKVFPYRRDSALEIDRLYQALIENEEYINLKYAQFCKLLERLQQQDYLPGIVCDGLYIFVEEEHFAWKTGVFSNAKNRIAQKAITYIRSGYTIAMDAGSTTLEVTKQLCKGLRMKAWKDLKVVTNSLSSATELLNVASDLGWDDSSAPIEVYIIGGRIRPSTLAIVNDDLDFKEKLNDDFKNMLIKLGGADIAFVGCNGIHVDKGFCTHNNVEVYTKQDILQYSKEKYILSDPSKFGLKEEKSFASFNDDIKIITTNDGFESTLDNYHSVLENTNTKIILA